MVPDTLRPILFERLVAQVEEMEWHIDCDILGAKYVMHDQIHARRNGVINRQPADFRDERLRLFQNPLESGILGDACFHKLCAIADEGIV